MADRANGEGAPDRQGSVIAVHLFLQLHNGEFPVLAPSSAGTIRQHPLHALRDAASSCDACPPLCLFGVGIAGCGRR